MIKDQDGYKYVEIKDPLVSSAATVEITPGGILIHTAFSRYSYRIFREGVHTLCEYNGAYRGLLQQQLLPKFSPNENLLEVDVYESTLYGAEATPRKLREYAKDNLMQRMWRKMHTPDEQKGTADFDHPEKVYDEFIKEDYVPPRKQEEDKKR